MRFLSDKYFIHLLLAEINKFCRCTFFNLFWQGVEEEAKEKRRYYLAFQFGIDPQFVVTHQSLKLLQTQSLFADAAKDTPMPAIKSAVANLVNFIIYLPI